MNKCSLMVLLACTAAVLPVLAGADEPAVNVQAFATTQAILDFCARVNPRAADQFAQQAMAEVQGRSAEAVAALRRSEEYKQAYDSITDMISHAPEKEAQRACAESAAAR